MSPEHATETDGAPRAGCSYQSGGSLPATPNPTLVVSPQERLLGRIHTAIVRLRKELVEPEKVKYEKTQGKIFSTEDFQKFRASDPRFKWLLPVSQLLTAIGETFDKEEHLTTEKFDELITQVRSQFMASTKDSKISEQYADALTRDPDVSFAHEKVTQLLG